MRTNENVIAKLDASTIWRQYNTIRNCATIANRDAAPKIATIYLCPNFSTPRNICRLFNCYTRMEANAFDLQSLSQMNATVQDQS
jgi:hypothetical protein